MLYEHSKPLIVPRLKITDEDKSKRYFAMQSYYNK